MLQQKLFWVAYTFLQKPSSFKFLSILEENCVANINHGAIKCKFLLTNVSQNVFWVSYTFLQKLSSFMFYSNLEKIVVSTSLMEQLNVRLLLTIAAKVVFWVGYTFLQKWSSFKFLRILEENCGADIINKTFKCKSFVDKCCKTRSFKWVILSYKSQVLSSFPAI